MVSVRVGIPWPEPDKARQRRAVGKKAQNRQAGDDQHRLFFGRFPQMVDQLLVGDSILGAHPDRPACPMDRGIKGLQCTDFEIGAGGEEQEHGRTGGQIEDRPQDHWQAPQKSRPLSRQNGQKRHQKDREMNPVPWFGKRHPQPCGKKQLGGLRGDRPGGVGSIARSEPASDQQDRLDRQNQCRQSVDQLQGDIERGSFAINPAVENVAPVQIPEKAGHPTEQKSSDFGVLLGQREKAGDVQIVGCIRSGTRPEQGIHENRVVDRLPEIGPHAAVGEKVKAGKQKGCGGGGQENAGLARRRASSGVLVALKCVSGQECQERARSSESSRILFGDKGQTAEKPRGGDAEVRGILVGTQNPEAGCHNHKSGGCIVKHGEMRKRP